MKSYELIPTEENLVYTLKRDLLNRNKDLIRFYELLLAQESASSIAIDGRWGSGKTFFVKQATLLINAKNSNSNISDSKKMDIMSAFKIKKRIGDAIDNNNLAVYYDAWENDNDTDPILSLIYEIIKQLGIRYVFNDVTSICKAGVSLFDSLTGNNITGLIENLKSGDPFEKLKEEKNLNDKIRNFFSEILEKHGNRLVIFIDELDRCKPSYAIQLLERIKHYLCDERITFVYSVNLYELQHTIKHYYGNEFDACRYLDRFFDLRISLPLANKTEFYKEIGLDSSDIPERICRMVIDTYDMELREATRFYRQVKTAAYEPMHSGDILEFALSDGKGKKLLLIYVVPILIGLKIVDISLYNEFVSGENSKPLMDMYRDSIEGKWLAVNLLKNNESFEIEDEKNLVSIEKKLQELYDAIFAKKHTRSNFSTKIGNCVFNNESREYIKNIESMLSIDADYEI